MTMTTKFHRLEQVADVASGIAAAQSWKEAGFRGAEKAGYEFSPRAHAEAIALRAEGLGDWSDDPDGPDGPV